MKIPPCLAALALFVSVAACAGAGEQRILYVYTWEDYFPRAEVEAFEQEHGCTVEFDYYDSNETMLTTLLEAGGHDIRNLHESDAPYESIREGILLD